MSGEAPVGQAATSPRLTLVILSVGVCSFGLLQSLVLPVLPLVQQKLHTSQSAVIWVLTAYLLSASVATPLLGRVGDLVGRKKVLVAVLAALAGGSFLAALAPSIGVMIAARAIAGVGSAMLPLSFGIIRDEFPPEQVSSAIGILAATTAVGGGLGLVLAGPIIITLGYHWLFWFPSIIVVLAAVTAYLFIPESGEHGGGRISLLPALMMSAWLVAALIAVSEAPSWGWVSSRVIVLLLAAVVLAGGWVWAELRAARPLVDMRMMRLSAIWTANLVAILFGIGNYSLFAFIPRFVQTPTSAGYGFGASITESGLIALPAEVLVLVSGSLTGLLSKRFGARNVLIVGCVISVVPMVMLTLWHDAVWQIAVAMGLVGLGSGATYSALSGIVVNAVPSHLVGVASGMNANIRTIGGAIGAAVMSSIVTARLQEGGLPSESGFIHGFGLLAGVSVLCALAASLVPRHRQHEITEARRSPGDYDRV